MIRTRRPRATIVFEVAEISAFSLGKWVALAGLVGSIAIVILVVRGYENPTLSRGLAVLATAVAGLTLGGFLGGIVLATLYNVLARYLGGVRIHLAPLTPSEAAGIALSVSKACPACQADVRADLSFCPECDHKFSAVPKVPSDS
jgi:hypothetical protein